ncbi:MULTISPECIES: hypothetical protein [Burkholderiaceae]|jgi:hypothetical protein|uniref:Uncharacterized protein n=1 Tax=Burkholderia vietnamiensis TaxID=60552 RepID=A0AAW7TBX1_BURVI|nr:MULTISPECIES: hypothetical protein [Burkholderiaceae]MDN7799579.1 hypothetical protein [Burkholderia vietnamiensis]RFU44299.1 hypothetical protein D0B32_29140 [Paraburkholderia sp. DHOC27]
MTSPLQIIEPLIEAAALIAGVTWLFRTVCRTVRTARDHIRFTAATAGITFLTAVVLEYARLSLPGHALRVCMATGSALLLLIVGIAWLRPAILLLTRLHLPPSLLSFVPPLKNGAPSAPRPLAPAGRRRCGWVTTGIAAGILVAALNNGDVPTAASIPVSLALVLISWWLATGLAGTRPALTNTTLRIIAGALFAALGSFQLSQLLDLAWSHPASVLWGLIALYLVVTYWLIATCRDGTSRYPQTARLLSAPVEGSLFPATARARNTMVLIGVCLWTATASICLHFEWHTALGMMDWQTGLLLFLGFVIVLVASVLLDVRLPGGG